MERYKQALEIFLKIDKTSPNSDHEVCYYIGKWRGNVSGSCHLNFDYKMFELYRWTGDLLYRKCNRMQVAVNDEVKEYFHRAVRDGKHLDSYNLLADIYKAENNLPKAIEMLENTTQ